MGPAGISGWEMVLREVSWSSSVSGAEAVVLCPLGKKVIGGGGGNAALGDTGYYVSRSEPWCSGLYCGWEVYLVARDGPRAGTGRAWAICAYVD
jgi:hypothetical protein